MSEENTPVQDEQLDAFVESEATIQKDEALQDMKLEVPESISPVPIKLAVVQKSGAVIGPDMVVTLTVDGEPVKMKRGYMFIDPKLDVTHRGKKITPETLTHAAAVQMIKEQPLFFRYNMDGGFYPLDHSYWK